MNTLSLSLSLSIYIYIYIYIYTPNLAKIIELSQLECVNVAVFCSKLTKNKEDLKYSLQLMKILAS